MSGDPLRPRRGDSARARALIEELAVAERTLREELGAEVDAVVLLRETQRALRRSEALFRGVLEDAPDATLVVDATGRIVLVNGEAERLFGRPRAALLGHPIELLVPDSIAEAHVAHRAAFLADPGRRQMGPTSAGCPRARRADGSEVEVEVMLAPLVHEGELLVLCTVRDIGARLRAEARLHRLNRALAVRSEVNQALVVARESGAYLGEVCRIAVDRGGYPLAWIALPAGGGHEVRPIAVAGPAAGFLAGANVSCDGDDPLGRGPTGTALRTGQVACCHDVASDPGVAPWRERALAHGLRAAIALPLLHEGRALGALCLAAGRAGAFDPEEQQLLRELAADVAFGLHSLRLRAERDELHERVRRKEQLEALGSLAGGVAHDFNNMLSVILGAAELSQRPETSPAAAARHLAAIRAAGERAAGLTAQLLAFSRRQHLEPRHVEVDALVAGVRALLERVLGEHVELTFAAGADGAWIRVDPQRTEQAIINLATNARDALPSGGHVTIETAAVELGADGGPADLAAGPYVRISVVDDGTGMDAETAARAFEPFFTTKPVGKGTGLGLASVHGFASQSGGGVVITSAPGRGTRVDLYLPQVESSQPPAPASAREEARGRGGETIVLAEDEPLVRALLQEVLEAGGYEVVPAGDGLEALEALARTPGAALLLTDVRMPRLGGVELARRARERTPSLVVVFMSGYPEDELEDDPEARALLSKPIAPAALLARVRGQLDARASPDAQRDQRGR